MSHSQSFIRAWFNWRRTQVPWHIFRRHRLNDLLQRVEYELDHQSSYLYSLGGSLMESKQLSYTKLAEDELINLDKIKIMIEDCLLTENEKKELENYIIAVQSLLKEIKVPFN